MINITKLHEIPRGSIIYATVNDVEGSRIVFDHLDGMLYSYCYLENDTRAVIHLSRMTPLVKYKDGYKIKET